MPFLPSSATLDGIKTLISALSDPEDLWELVKQAIELIPTEREDQKQDESVQTTFSSQRTRKIFCTFVQKVLDFMPAPPIYTSVVRRDKRKYAYIYQLIDKILPFAADSSDRTVQLDLLQTR